MKDAKCDKDIIIEILNSRIYKRIDEYKEFHVGEFINKPNQYGCFKRNSDWYMYINDEKNFCTFTGPFNVDGIIYACAKLLNVAKVFQDYRFSEEELTIYLNNFFHSFEEIDEHSK